MRWVTSAMMGCSVDMAISRKLLAFRLYPLPRSRGRVRVGAGRERLPLAPAGVTGALAPIPTFPRARGKGLETWRLRVQALRTPIQLRRNRCSGQHRADRQQRARIARGILQHGALLRPFDMEVQRWRGKNC